MGGAYPHILSSFFLYPSSPWKEGTVELWRRPQGLPPGIVSLPLMGMQGRDLVHKAKLLDMVVAGEALGAGEDAVVPRLLRLYGRAMSEIQRWNSLLDCASPRAAIFGFLTLL